MHERPAGAGLPEHVPVFIRVRRTIDWSDEAAVAAELRADFRGKMETWNDTLDMPYHRFRQRLKEIAFHNFARVEGAVLATNGTVPVGAAIVPVDDDDWFAPDLVRHLRAGWSDGALGCHWTRFILEARTAMRLRALLGRQWSSGRHYLCGTNNYAVLNVNGWEAATAGHAKADRLFRREPGLTVHIDRRLSVQNRNVSSQTVLGWRRDSVSPRTVRRRFDRYRRLYVRPALPADLDWAIPYVQMMRDLMDAVSVRN